jgi:hypothetical protein
MQIRQFRSGLIGSPYDSLQNTDAPKWNASGFTAPPQSKTRNGTFGHNKGL